MSGPLPKFMYRDPLDVLLYKEAATCKGCIYEHSDFAFGKKLTVCTKVDDRGIRERHGRRCKHYRDR